MKCEKRTAHTYLQCWKIKKFEATLINCRRQFAIIRNLFYYCCVISKGIKINRCKAFINRTKKANDLRNRTTTEFSLSNI